MATQPTQDAVPSESPRDLKFNAGKIDEFVTSMGWTYIDRFGQKHYTIEGINYLSQQAMAAYGYVILTGKTFTTGATINNPNEVLLNTADGEYFKWTGSFASGPKVVPANSTPASTGGIAPGAWIGVGDASLRAALASVSGAGLVGVSVGSVYPAGTVGSAIQYRTPQMYGIEPSTTNIIGSGLDAMFAAGGDIRFEKPGTYLTDRAWILRSGTRLWIGPGVTIRAASTYNGNLLRNYAYETDGGAGTADDIIEIWGAGTLDYDGLEKPFSGLNAMGAIFKNVTTLRIGGGLMFRNSRKYCWLICKVQNLHADGLRFNTISDGIHLQPPIENAWIKNLSGVTGDDFCALTDGDYPNYDIAEPGDFANINIEGIYVRNVNNDEGTRATSLVALGTAGMNTFRSISVSKLYGQSGNCVLYAKGDAQSRGRMKIERLAISDVFATPGPGAQAIVIDGLHGPQPAGVTYAVEIDTLSITNIMSQSAANQPLIMVTGDTNAQTIVHSMTIDGTPRTAYSIVNLGANASQVTVGKLNISNCNTLFIKDPNSAIVNTRGYIGSLVISNSNYHFDDSTYGYAYRGVGVDGRIDSIFMSNCRQDDGVNVVSVQRQTQQVAVHISNTEMFGVQTGVNFINVSSARLFVDNCWYRGDSGYTFIASNGSSVILRGSVETDGNNAATTSNGGTITLARGMQGISCDVSKITSMDGAGCHNTNGSLSCGSGQVVVQTKVWKNLFSSATYTSSI